MSRALDALKDARAAILDGVTPDAVLTECERARSALGDTAPRPAGKYGGLDTIKSRLSLSNGALR